MNYQEATTLYNTAKNKEAGKPLENNTRLVKTNAGYGIKLWDTVVVEILPNNNYVLNTGGWYTSTTKDRINKYAPVPLLGQEASQWYIYDNNGKVQSRFYNDMIINSAGVPLKPEKPEISEKILKKQKELKKKIKEYAVKCGTLAGSHKLPEPSGGDCWYCSMHEVKTGKPLGDLNGSDHLLQHIKDHYIVPALVYNALKETGYRWPEIIGWGSMPVPDSVQRAVTKYLQRRLLPR